MRSCSTISDAEGTLQDSMGAGHALLEACYKESGYIVCPNGGPAWLAGLADFSVLQMAVWPTASAAAKAK